MTDQTPVVDQPTEDLASDQPEATEELNLVQALSAEFDKRFSGLQSLMDKREAKLLAEIDALKTVNLSPEELEQREVDRERAEKDALRRENALLKLARQYPEDEDFILKFFEADSLEDQIKLLSEVRKPKAEAATDEPAQPTPVKGNNPSRPTKQTLLDTGGEMTKDLAMEILKANDKPGILTKLRRQGR